MTTTKRAGILIARSWRIMVFALAFLWVSLGATVFARITHEVGLMVQPQRRTVRPVKLPTDWVWRRSAHRYDQMFRRER